MSFSLEPYLPHPRLVEFDQLQSAAPAAEVERIRHLDLGSGWVFRSLARLRGHRGGSLQMDELLSGSSGLVLLEDHPRDGFAVATVGRFWIRDPQLLPMDREAFGRFDTPGWGKLAWAIRVWGPHTWMVETRMTATDEQTWGRLSRYYRWVGPASRWVRRQLLAESYLLGFRGPRVSDASRPR